MNKKAELFNEYLEKNKIDVFAQEELKDDQINTVVFRSRLDVEGNMLPMMVALDDSIYAIIRVQVVMTMRLLYRSCSTNTIASIRFSSII